MIEADPISSNPLEWWRRVRLPLGFALTAFTLVVARGEFAEASFIPVMAFVACAIPASGAPISGGVVFVPTLTLYGMCARDAVAFTAAVQVFGVGIFAPLNWLLEDRHAIVWSAYRVLLPASALGFVTAACFPLSGEHGDHVAILVFVGFCVILFAYTAAFILSTPSSSNVHVETAHRPLEFNRASLMTYALASYAAAIITFYVGVCSDKVVFMLLTYVHGVSARRATITGTTLVGLLSLMRVVYYVSTACAPDQGHIPFRRVVLAVPALLLGSLAGVRVNLALGSKNVMYCFLALLAFDIVSEVRKVHTEWEDASGACVPLPTPMSCETVL